MTYEVLHAFAGITVAVSGFAIGLCSVIVMTYWHVYRRVRNGARLLPLHIMLIGTSYSMIAFVAATRLGNPPPPGTREGWWIYPFITLAFVLGDIALILILKFVAKRGTRPAGDRRVLPDPTTPPPT